MTPDGEIVWKYINPVRDTMGPGGPRGPVELLPFFLRDMLNLSSQQRKDLDAFQKQVAGKFEAILTADQRKQLQSRRGFGPGSFAPPGQLLSLSTQIMLKLTPEQKTRMEELQKQTDAKLDALLTEKQKPEFKRMRDDFARGGPPGFGPGGPGRPGGPPDRGPGPRGGPPSLGPGGPPLGPPGFFGRGGGPPGFGPGGGPPGFGGPPGGDSVFRAYRYGPDYPGLAGRDLTSGKTVEELQPKEPKPK